ncbi:Aspartyl-tRNA(Asn) amidotransferase subunit A (EC @ Glutamyl-tRNA(Gln) amidotransferase subunit A (EC [uncultured Gammaproteobacteria bacterium]|nr:Aspartyl-tRNA(Asn) amidotransferase subunit A (EC @ Glutamyl-tRNA(Gln) amidotransferase subunit A (EC [uncultured Gammaproteobacteria bacterium]
MNIHDKTIAELAQGLKNKEFSSVELTQHYLDRINASDLNAFITITDEIAIKQAQVADQHIASSQSTTLTGIPYAHKDIFCTHGVKTSAASKMLDNFIAPYDATVSHKLNQSGLVMLGKANMDEFAMGSSNESSFYGAVKNPWDTNKVPGGSSVVRPWLLQADLVHLPLAQTRVALFVSQPVCAALRGSSQLMARLKIRYDCLRLQS